MKVVKKEMIHWMDQKAINDYSIPSIILMEHAALALYDAFQCLYDNKHSVLVVCGPGNNGGDGFALARLLYQNHYDVKVYCHVPFDKMSHDELVNANIVKALEIPYYYQLDDLNPLLNDCDVVVDALFGVGLARDIKGDYATIIQILNDSKKDIVSVDIASGIDGTTGMMKGCAVLAKHTFTLAAYKEGLFINDARTHCGSIQCLDIQIPQALNKQVEGATILNEKVMKEMLVKRLPYSHKGSYGKALMIGGSLSMHGALTLAAKACLQSGIGTLTLFVPDCITTILANKLEECMLISAPSKEGYFSEESITLLKQVMNQYDFVVIGNGMGRSEACLNLVDIVLQSDKPCIIDGDGIYLASQCDIPYNKQLLMTPHVKEMSYLCHINIKDVMNQPFDQVKDYMKNKMMTLVYKDAFTLIQNQDESYFYYQPNTALAKGGSGDVLCGIIAGMYGQSKDLLKSACLGVYIHSMCALESLDVYGEDASQASYLIDSIGKVLKKLRNF